MSMRFRKSFNLGGGVKVNVNKNSIGISAGGKLGRVSINTKGQLTQSTSLRGTGISLQERTSLKPASAKSKSHDNSPKAIYDTETILPKNRKQVESIAAPIEDSAERMIAFARIGIKASIVSPYGDNNLCVVCGKKKSVFTN